MWSWILILSLPIITLAIIEETIQFLVNRKIFGNNERPFKLKEKFKYVKEKFTHRKSPS